MNLKSINLVNTFALLLFLFSNTTFAQVLQDFETVEAGATVAAFPNQGISFGTALEGVRCDPNSVVRANSNCLSAKSGNIVVRPTLAGEFARNYFKVGFSALQNSVTVYMRYDGTSADNGEEIKVLIGAVDETDSLFKSKSYTFTHQFNDGLWHPVTVTEQVALPPFSPGIKISGIEIWGGRIADVGIQPDRNNSTNFLLVDDLTFTQTGVLPEDTLPPVISYFLVPSTTAEAVFPADIRAYDQGPEETRRLATVDLRIEHESGSVLLEYDNGNLCGNPTTGTCPLISFSTADTFTIGLDPGLPGEYALAVRACDASGNCSAPETRMVILEAPPPPPPPVQAHWMEINQGTQTMSGFFKPVQNGISTSPSGELFIPTRDTLVRYYLTSTDSARANYQEDLVLKVWLPGGTTPSYTIPPNTQFGNVDLEIDPGDSNSRSTLAISQRPDLTKSLNFVIPSELIADATMFSLRLGHFGIGTEPVTGEMQVALYPSATFGLLPIQIVDPRFTTPTPADLQQQNDILRAQFPISGELLYPNPGLGAWDARTGGVYPHILRFAFYPSGRSNGCSSVLSWTQSLFSGDLNTYRAGLSGAPDKALILGMVGDGFDDCAGMAYRPGRTSIAEVTSPFRQIVSNQELVHNLGVKHAGDHHDESDGGSTEPWPYPHGHISPDGVSTFGVVTKQTSTSSIGGRWAVLLIDPCKTTPLGDMSQRRPDCTLATDSEIMHDFMTYQIGPLWTGGVPTGSNFFTWSSDITWQRIYDKIQAASTSAASLKSGPAEALQAVNAATVQALIVAGTIDTNGDLTELEPLIRKALPADALTPSAGDHAIELLDSNGLVILSHAFAATVNDDETGGASFWIAMADSNTPASKLQIKNAQNAQIGSLTASDNPPTVQVLSPNGGETLGPGSITISWEAGDADGDQLHYMVQMSPDLGQTWQGIALTEPAAPKSITLPVDGLIPSSEAIIRVIASDGFHSSSDDSDAKFSINSISTTFIDSFD